MKRIKKIVYIIIGSLAVILGTIGIFIPILPTTPLLLLASFLFFRSSKKMNEMLLNNRILGDYIKNYMEHRAVRRSTKVVSIAFLWVTLTVSAIIVDNLYIRILLGAVGIGVTIHLLSLKTLEKTEAAKEDL